ECESKKCEEPNPYSKISNSCAPADYIAPEPDPEPIPQPIPKPLPPATMPAKEVRGLIYFIDEKSKVIPLALAKVVFEYDDPQGVHHEDPNFFVWTDKDGKFSWSNSTVFAPGNKIDVLLSYEDQQGRAKIVTDSSSLFYLGRNISAEDNVWSNFEKNLDNWDSKALAKIYVNVIKAVDFSKNVFNSPQELEEVRAFSQIGTSHLDEIYSGGSNVVGMRIENSDSYFPNPEAPTNREFHEYCHHIQATILKEKRIPLGNDHGGYFNNPDSEWGLIEGWAEFCALQMKKYYKTGTPWIYEYGSSQANLEMNYVLGANKKRSNDEEFAIAGILLDLTDSTSDYGNHDDDFVSIPLSEVWKAFSEKRDFSDGKGIRGVYNLHDLYSALKEVTTDNIALHDVPVADNVSNFDRLFIMHGAFQDVNLDKKWNLGETVGLSGRGVLEREEVKPEPGTELIFNIKQPFGVELTTGLLANVVVQIDAPNDYL
ncbi:MAG: hypothetical protein Q7K42_05060, partial [Candidatus Diapherotrites archaeon]|nr:hypothetical protein [Candidatus Diapherotrites archaeon]